MVDEADMDGKVSETEFLRIMNKTEMFWSSLKMTSSTCQGSCKNNYTTFLFFHFKIWNFVKKRFKNHLFYCLPHKCANLINFFFRFWIVKSTLRIFYITKFFVGVQILLINFNVKFWFWSFRTRFCRLFYFFRGFLGVKEHWTIKWGQIQDLLLLWG